MMTPTRTQLKNHSVIVFIWSFLFVMLLFACSDESTPLNFETTSPVCPPEAPYGCNVGDTLKDWSFVDCDENSVSLHDVCGNNAVLVYIFYGWCSSCFDFIRNASDLQAEYASRGLEAVIVVVEDTLSRPVTSDYCSALRDTYSLSWTLAMDPEAQIAQCGNSGTVILLNESGKIVFKRDDATTQAIRTAIDQELDSP